ncbi:hypothetical protein Tco_0537913 [Tanacetum coccineum]
MAQENQQQDRAYKELVPMTYQVRIGLRNYRISLEKQQPKLIYRLFLAILKQYSFFNAFTAIDDVREIYMQQFWLIVSLDLSTKTYFFKLDDQIFEVGTNLLHEALKITPKYPDHPFIKPPPHDKIISFIKKLGYPGSLDQVSKMVINHMYQPWRTFMTMIKKFLIGKASGFNRPRLALINTPDKSVLRIRNCYHFLGVKDPIYGMAIPKEMTSNEIKASADYLNYLAKSVGTQPAKGQGKGLITKKGIEFVVRKKEIVKIPRKKHTKTVIEETGQSEELVDTVSLEETESDEEERHVNERRSGLVIRREVNMETDEGTPNNSTTNKNEFILQQHSKGHGEGSSMLSNTPDDQSDDSSSSQSESDDEVEMIYDDNERTETDGSKNAEDKKIADDKAEEEKARNEQPVDEQAGDEQVGEE